MSVVRFRKLSSSIGAGYIQRTRTKRVYGLDQNLTEQSVDSSFLEFLFLSDLVVPTPRKLSHDVSYR